MPKIKWTNKDFNVFQIDGLEQRMDALNECVRPKFQLLAEDFSSFFSSQLGEEFYPHVAKHARRTVNPQMIAGLHSLRTKEVINHYLTFRLDFGAHIYSSS